MQDATYTPWKSQLTVAREHRILFLQDKYHVVDGMARRVVRTQCCALHAEYLAILDTALTRTRLMLVDRHVRAKLQKIRDTFDMIMVPVGE